MPGSYGVTMPPIRQPLALRVADPRLHDAFATICADVRAAGGRAWLVGGSVRDLVLGMPAKDLDIEVYGLPPQRVVEVLSARFPVDLVGHAFCVIKVHGLPIDVSLPRRETKVGLGHRAFDALSDPWMSFEEAAARRDFTINALAYDPQTGEVLDAYGGLADVRDRRLRHTSDKFAEDPLRVLRGMQLAGRYGLQVHVDTVGLARQLFHEYGSLPVERIWGEWAKWAARAATPSLGLTFLKDCGWNAAYPELTALEGCPQDPEWHPEGDVWTHTLFVTDAAAAIAARDGLEEENRLVLVLAALCHDLGKPATTEVDGGRVRSRGHAGRVDEIESFLNRIGTPLRLIERAVALCRQHLAHCGFAGSPAHVRRLARTLGEAGETIQMLGRLVEADHSGRPPLPPHLPEQMGKMLRIAQDLNTADTAPKPILLGRHLIELGLQPGPGMGDLLRRAYEAQLDGAFNDLDGARIWAGRHA